MPKFKVTVVRRISSYAFVEVEAATAEEAENNVRYSDIADSDFTEDPDEEQEVIGAEEI